MMFVFHVCVKQKMRGPGTCSRTPPAPGVALSVHGSDPLCSRQRQELQGVMVRESSLLRRAFLSDCSPCASSVSCCLQSGMQE